ncbi:sialidase-like [Monomorium pharaonis]|uniref:sialidase-like n=1 Tax=Monomorium pharaonis TaxID=307658 RepID=UPI00174674D6|nr:sialidase-like [Monomorium pharaonis]
MNDSLEILDSRHNRHMPIRDPGYIIEAKREAAKKENIRKSFRQSTLHENVANKEQETLDISCTKTEITTAALARDMEQDDDCTYIGTSHKDVTEEDKARRQINLDEVVIPISLVRENVLSDNMLNDESLDSFLRVIRETTEFQTQSVQYQGCLDYIDASQSKSEGSKEITAVHCASCTETNKENIKKRGALKLPSLSLLAPPLSQPSAAKKTPATPGHTSVPSAPDIPAPSAAKKTPAALGHTSVPPAPDTPALSAAKETPTAPGHTSVPPTPDTPAPSAAKETPTAPGHTSVPPAPDTPAPSAAKETPTTPVHTSVPPAPDTPAPSAAKKTPAAPEHTSVPPAPDTPAPSAAKKTPAAPGHTSVPPARNYSYAPPSSAALRGRGIIHAPRPRYLPPITHKQMKNMLRRALQRERKKVGTQLTAKCASEVPPAPHAPKYTSALSAHRETCALASVPEYSKCIPALPAQGYTPAPGYTSAPPVQGYMTASSAQAYTVAQTASGYTPAPSVSGYTTTSPAPGYTPAPPVSGYTTTSPAPGYILAPVAPGYTLAQGHTPVPTAQAYTPAPPVGYTTALSAPGYTTAPTAPSYTTAPPAQGYTPSAIYNPAPPVSGYTTAPPGYMPTVQGYTFNHFST